MRPRSITLFGRLWLVSILLSAAYAWITRERVQHMLEGNPQSAQVAPWFLPGWIALVVAFCLLLWYMVRHRSLTAKWIILLIAILSVGRAAMTLVNALSSFHPLSTLVALACTAATVAATFCLFRPDARLWFGEDVIGDPLADDPEVHA